MTLRAIILSAVLTVGFWALQRTWIWLGEAREFLDGDREEVRGDC